MSGNDGSMYWITNKEWWRIEGEKGFALTDKAPEEAKESFRLWCRINNEHCNV